jgi:hypothetical protein
MERDEEKIKKVCIDLGIKYDVNDQDWGIMYSDAKRLDEFMAYYNTTELDDYQQFNVFELIVASYNDAILEGGVNKSQKDIFSHILNKTTSNKKLDIVKDYWRRISNNEEFPVGKLL